MTIENTDTLELKERYIYLIKKYLEITPSLTLLLEDFGRVRNELEKIVEEMKKRNISIEELELQHGIQATLDKPV